MKIANLNIPAAILVDSLRLPEGTEIVSASMKFARNGEITLSVIHEDLDDVQPGDFVPDVDVVVFQQPKSQWIKHKP